MSKSRQFVFRSRYAGYSITAGSHVQFQDGVAVIDDPTLANRLRSHRDCGPGLDFWEEQPQPIPAVKESSPATEDAASGGKGEAEKDEGKKRK